jgi:hypothetical protein
MTWANARRATAWDVTITDAIDQQLIDRAEVIMRLSADVAALEDENSELRSRLRTRNRVDLALVLAATVLAGACVVWG